MRDKAEVIEKYKETFEAITSGHCDCLLEDLVEIKNAIIFALDHFDETVIKAEAKNKINTAYFFSVLMWVLSENDDEYKLKMKKYRVRATKEQLVKMLFGKYNTEKILTYRDKFFPVKCKKCGRTYYATRKRYLCPYCFGVDKDENKHSRERITQSTGIHKNIVKKRLRY